MRAVAIIVVLAGCFTKPDARGTPIDAPPDVPGSCLPTQPSAPGMTLNATRDAVTIRPGMTLGFADESVTVPMPERITLNAVNFLATREECTIEDTAGIAMYPSFQLSPGAGVVATPVHSLLRMVTGPAYSQFRVNWQRNVMCSAFNVAEGETIFSVFPDGRIVRNDMVQPSNSATPVTAANCVCMGAGGTDFLVTSFYAFERTVLSEFARINEDFEPFTTSSLDGEQGGCVTLQAGGAVALYWDVVAGALPQPVPTRIRAATNTVAPNHQVLAFVFDLYSGPLMAGPSLGVRTTMVLDETATSCVPVSNRAVAKADQPAIQISPLTGASSLVAANAFGMYSDPDPHSGPVTLSVGPAGTVAAGFAVTMFLPGTAIATNRPAGDVIWQREEDGRFYIWFRQGLSGTETITITPEC